jgi:hypothetical protein
MKRLSDYEDLQEAIRQCIWLSGEVADQEGERDRLYTELNSSRNSRESDIDLQAKAMLSGKSEKLTETLKAQYQTVCQRLPVTRRALDMATAVRESLRARYSEEINKACEREYNKLMRQAVDAAVATSEAFSAAMRYRATMESDGVIVTLPRLDCLNKFGIYENGNAHIHHAISEAVAAGVIKPGTYEKPQAPGPYDHISTPIQAISAGPAGISAVEISRGGTVKVKEQTYTPPKPDSQTAWN